MQVDDDTAARLSLHNEHHPTISTEVMLNEKNISATTCTDYKNSVEAVAVDSQLVANTSTESDYDYDDADESQNSKPLTTCNKTITNAQQQTTSMLCTEIIDMQLSTLGKIEQVCAALTNKIHDFEQKYTTLQAQISAYEQLTRHMETALESWDARYKSADSKRKCLEQHFETFLHTCDSQLESKMDKIKSKRNIIDHNMLERPQQGGGGGKILPNNVNSRKIPYYNLRPRKL